MKSEALKVGDRLLLLERGRLVADGRPRDLVMDAGSLAAQFWEASEAGQAALPH